MPRLRSTAAALCLPIAWALGLSASAATTIRVDRSAYLGDVLAAHDRAQPGSASAAGTGVYNAGLAWYAARALPAQELAKRVLLANIAGLANADPKRAHAKSYVRMYQLLSAMPATGRIALPQTDPRYLQAHPGVDPLLEPGDTVVLPDRPLTVTVVRANGKLCPVRFVPGVQAAAYLQACDPAARPDAEWVAQPNGIVQSDRAGLWNAAAQDAPAPGAWIWGPDSDAVWPARVSRLLAAFLATQPLSEGAPTEEAASAAPSASSAPPSVPPHAPPSALSAASPPTPAAAPQPAPAFAERTASAPQPAAATTTALAPTIASSPQVAAPKPAAASTQHATAKLQLGGPAPSLTTSSAPQPAPSLAPQRPPSAAPAWRAAASSIEARLPAPASVAPPAPVAAAMPPAITLPQTLRQAPAARSLPVTADDWGEPGVLQTPTARMNAAGEIAVSVSHVAPYTRTNFIFQPLDWLEFGYRYTNISNRLYGPAFLSGTQADKDKSVDVRVLLHQETRLTPALAVGIQDIGGTGLFSGEYLVGSKRTGSVDWSLGLAWGYLGGRQNLGNPLSLLSRRFDTRPADTGAGNFHFNTYFRGRTALFAGVQYQTPFDPLVLKLEYDGNNYSHEPLGNVLPQRSPFNLGAVYRLTPNWDLGLGYERGNTVQAELTFHGNLAHLGQPKFGQAPQTPLRVAQPQYAQEAVASRTLDAAPDAAQSGELAAASASSHADTLDTPDSSGAAGSAGEGSGMPVLPAHWSHLLAAQIQTQCQCFVSGLRSQGADLVVEIDNPRAFYIHALVERIARTLVLNAPPRYSRFHVVLSRWGMPLTNIVIERAQWLHQHDQYVPAQQALPDSVPQAPLADTQLNAMGRVMQQQPSAFHVSVGPGYEQTLGSPNAFVLYQVSADAFATLRLAQGTWLAGELNAGLLDNYDKYTYTPPSNLPRVRTDMRQYVTTSRLTIPLLQLTHVGRLTPASYYSVYAGMLESMYAGVGGEWLYRPWNSPLAFGVNANAVRQRGFSQHFSLLPYSVVTGHATLYWQTGWNGVLAKISAGQYLAKDRGVTLDVSRTFANGVQIGAYATKTNLSAAQYGEGSFDKGIYVNIPFDALLTRSTDQVAHLLWQPLLRDGGAMLDRRYRLYDMTQDSSPSSLRYTSPLDSAFSTP